MTDLDNTPTAADAGPTSFTDRGISPISGRLAFGRFGRLAVGVALAAGCALVLAASWRAPGRAPPPHDQPAGQVVPFEGLKSATPTLAKPGPDAPSLTSPAPASLPAGADPLAGSTSSQIAPVSLAAVRAAPLLAATGSGVAMAPAAPDPVVPAIVASHGPTDLDLLRRGSSTDAVRATRLPDRNFLIIAGTQIPCLLQTAMDSATPGYVSCLVPRDVMSDNGAVVLLDKGTRVLGEYRSSLRQGQRRLFVLWTRAVTPTGVAIRLESPASDALGRAGFDGDVDTHFWARFGGGLLLSIVDDGADAAVPTPERATIARPPSDAAAIALQSSVDIQPSLRKPQGAEVAIFAAQDFDFSGVYGLKVR